MKIDWDVPVRMDDGLVLRADVFRPTAEGRYPVILSYGPYGKGLAFQEGYKTAWEIMARDTPDAVAGSSNQYANWEVVDPEKWVPDGYVCIRVDSRGAGRSPGYLCHNNARETHDIHLCVEWAAVQAWCSGKVGMNGISYYASNQWRAAAAASCGDLRLGGLVRQLSRRQPPRRHHLQLSQELAGHAGEDGAARAGRARREEPRYRRVRMRPRDAVARGAPEEPRKHVAGAAVSAPRRSLLPRAHSRSLQSHSPAALVRELGRAGTAHARQLRGVCGRGIPAD